ncbi:papain family cysteine protease domain-containing protein [Phthorimaea operculella]|nr:papain family cysteine protease domain-containing protein [Phthorimaea operculella]
MEAMADWQSGAAQRASKLTHWNGISTRLVAFSTVGVMEAMAAMQTGKVEPLSVQCGGSDGGHGSHADWQSGAAERASKLTHWNGISTRLVAFSAVGVMEAMAAMQTGKVEPLSVQEVIDCAGLGNSGCAGGDICLLLDWLSITNSPVETDKQYPLKLIDGACKLPKKNTTGVRVETFTCDDLVGKEDKILEMLATHGPVAVAVNALTWQNYLGGVIQYQCSGAPADLNHAVELVGYDLTHEVPYYIAKNSWGPEFGLSGYLNIAIGSNMCGLANEVASVDVKLT